MTSSPASGAGLRLTTAIRITREEVFGEEAPAERPVASPAYAVLPTPYLTIVAATRNDDHGGGLARRMQLCFENILAQAERHNLPTELILVEWNPPTDRPRLVDALPWPTQNRFCTVRIVEVAPQIHQRYKLAEHLPLYQMIAKNVGIRRSRGRFILATTIDLLFSDELCAWMAMGHMHRGRMYRADRRDVEQAVPLGASVEEQLAYCASHTLRIMAREGMLVPSIGRYFPPGTSLGRKFLAPEQLHIQACGDFQLMSREDWFRLHGYHEYDIFSWHLDTLLEYAAHFGGAPEEILPPDHCIYHIEHHYGASRQKAENLWQRYDPSKIHRISDEAMWVLTGKMARERKPILVNGEDWGLANENLPETVPVKAEWDTDAKAGNALFVLPPTGTTQPSPSLSSKHPFTPTLEMRQQLEAGIVRCLAHRFDEAIKIFQELAAAHPHYAEPLVNLGCLLWGLGRKENAFRAFQTAVAADPDSQEAAWHLGQVLWAIGNRRDAVDVYEQYLIRHPEAQEIATQTLQWFKEFQSPEPSEPPILRFTTDVSNDKSEEGQIQGMRSFRNQIAQALLVAEDATLPVLFQSELGLRYRQLLTAGLKSIPLTQEEKSFAYDLTKKFQENLNRPGAVRHTLAAMLYLYPHEMPVDFQAHRAPDWLRSEYWQFLSSPPPHLLEGTDLDSYTRYIVRLLDRLQERSQKKAKSKLWAGPLHAFADFFDFYPVYNHTGSFKTEAEKRGEILQRLFATEASANLEETGAGGKIRLGVYLSTLNPTPETVAALPLFLELDPEFEVLVYAPTSANPQDLEEKIRRRAEIRRLPEDRSTWPAILRADRLDLLVFGCNPASPMNECVALAHQRLARRHVVHAATTPLTTGFPSMDTFVVGEMLSPAARRPEDYTEQCISIEGSGLCFAFPQELQNRSVALRRAPMLEGKTLFFTSAHACRITSNVQETWIRILQAVPNSVLMASPFGEGWKTDFSKDSFISSWKERWRSANLAEDRLLILKPSSSVRDLVDAISLCDVYLDAFPYNGVVSIAEALIARVPPIMLEGDSLRFARGSALVREIGLSQLVVHTIDDYIRIAVDLGSSTERLRSLRQDIHRRMQENPPFLDTRLYARRIAEVYGRILQGS